ncbi:uncharacterized protein N7511_008149 [Penicillium nucicola]|uniref:uncharacterized protein n=1 Tax=Penicillium nucicola TaxID=1850975 RepID=UPI002545988A|nr:uncharacterized protein N7511_008149 [Penicillium nucicola]KAJ5753996.1 hypothetical protein N7511_008149 [Penicillium nucicola]
MAARFSRSLPQVNRQIFAKLSPRTITRVARANPHAGLVAYRTGNFARGICRVKQVNIARYAHTDSGSSANATSPSHEPINYKGSSLTEKHWMRQDFTLVDALIAPQAIVNFLEFAVYGILPNGKKTDLALLNQAELHLLVAPSTQWAAAPFNKEDTPTVVKVMGRILEPEGLSGLCNIGNNIHFLKNRLWGGLAPVPASRWREKDLNNLDHFTIAHEYLTSVISVFEYLNIPQCRTSMCDTFNKISGDLRETQNALNALRKAQDSLSPEVNLTALWEQFIRAQYEVMTSTAHSWILARVTELREQLLDSFTAIPADKLESPEMELITERWSDLISVVSMADFNIWISMDGYNGYNPPSEIVAGLHNPDLASQDKSYGFSQLLLERLTQCIEAQNEAAKVQGLSATQSDAARRERLSISTVVQDELRQKIRGRVPSPQPPVQPWIQKLFVEQEANLSVPPEERQDVSIGLAIYRAVDKFSDEQWEGIRRDLEAQFSAWGDDVQRADEIKPLLKLHWFDSKELGFDSMEPVTAARRHFQQIRSSDEWKEKIVPSFFLVADPMGVGSYIDEQLYASYRENKDLLNGDFQGNVLAVDADFDNSATADASADGTAKEESQDKGSKYSGQTRILANLVWNELYAMLAPPSVGLEYLWQQTLDHPLKIYTGPTVPSQVAPWKEWNTTKTAMMDNFMEFLKKKDPSLAGKVGGLRKEGIL